MEVQKPELLEKLEEKKISVAKAAEAIGFDPRLLGLYLVNDTYPVPKRILEKLAKREGVVDYSAYPEVPGHLNDVLQPFGIRCEAGAVDPHVPVDDGVQQRFERPGSFVY